MLSHRVGLARGDLAVFGGFPGSRGRGDVVSALQCLPPLGDFRSGFVYSNLMYSLGGYVVERMTNQTFDDVIADRLLGPLRMTSTLTSFNPSAAYQGLAQPYVTVRGRLTSAHSSLFKQHVFSPALGLATTSGDMAKWLQVQLSMGVTPSGERVIDEDILQETRTPTTMTVTDHLRPAYPIPDVTFAYGLGWYQAVYRGFRRMWHPGTLFGYTSLVWVFPDQDFAIFAATNGPAREPDTSHKLAALFMYISDVMLGHVSWIDQSNACVYPNPISPLRNTHHFQFHLPNNSREQMSDVRNTHFKTVQTFWKNCTAEKTRCTHNKRGVLTATVKYILLTRS